LTAIVQRSDPSTDRLDRGSKLFYGFGSVAFGVKDNGFSYMLLLFYNQVLGLPATQVGFALMIALVFDAMIDPLVGQFSDNLRTPWGRRHPLMYAAALPLALAYLAIWNPPHWDHKGLFAYLVCMAVLIRGVISFYEVPSAALAAEFTTGYDERTVLLSYRYFFGWVGGLALYVIALKVILVPDALHPVGQLNPAGYARYGVVASIIMFAAILISALGTHRYIPTLRAPPPRRRLGPIQMLVEMRETLSSRSFLFLLASSICTSMAAGLATSLNVYFNTYYWGFSASQIGTLATGVFLSVIVSLPLAPFFSRRFGKRASAIVLTLLALVIGLAPIALRLLGLFPANGSPALFWILMATSILGTAFSIMGSVMGSSMTADVVEEAELKTGRRAEGLFFAASSFVYKAISGFGILAAALVVDRIHLGQAVDPSKVPPETLRHLALVYIPALTVLYLTGLTLLFGYKITRSTHAETLRELAADAEQAVHTA
jgi:Na+/melibiose symporter-like transporter